MTYQNKMMGKSVGSGNMTILVECQKCNHTFIAKTSNRAALPSCPIDSEPVKFIQNMGDEKELESRFDNARMLEQFEN